MDKWEYNAITFEHSVDLIKMNELGAEGWEAYGVVRTELIMQMGDTGYPYLATVHYLKRRVRDDEPVVD